MYLPQVLWNKLQISSILAVSKTLNRLEQVLISRGVLFKKVIFLPKGHF